MNEDRQHIIIVDDDPVILFMMKHNIILNGLHSNPNTFESGSSSLDFLRQHYNPEEHFVIFLDINMPTLDGWQFLDEIRSFTEPNNTIVFIISSSTDDADLERANKNSYVVDFLAKPVMVEKIQEIKQTLSKIN